MSSLKAFTPKLAALLGTTPIALYERQRALVRAELLELSTGRGPGSGVRLTPQAVATLLISVMSTDYLSDAADRTREMVQAVPNDGECAATGKSLLLASLTAILSKRVKMEYVKDLRVSRTTFEAELQYGFGRTKFSGRKTIAPGLENWTVLKGKRLRMIADALSEMLGSDDDVVVKTAPAKQPRGRARSAGK